MDRSLVPWNKGKTKDTHPSLARLSQTLKSNKEWNFSKWQKTRIKIPCKDLKKDKDLAELIGIVLGDGCIEKFPRTERLHIVCNSNERNYVSHIANLIKNKFDKTPRIFNRRRQKAVDITIY